MYCPKCKHTSFDHLATCPKCGSDWQSIRTALNLNWLQSAGHEWLPEPPSESPKAEPEPGSSASPEPMDFKPDDGAQEDFAFEDQAVEEASLSEDFLVNVETAPPVSTPELSADIDHPAVSEDIAVSIAAPGREGSEFPLPDAGIELDVMEDFSLESGSAREADPQTTGPADDTKPVFSKETETDEEALPVWEIELPQDLLPQDFFPDPAGEQRGPGEKNDGHEPEVTVVAGDIAYDFSEVEVVVPEPDGTDQALSPGGTASQAMTDRGDAKGSSALPSSNNAKEGR